MAKKKPPVENLNREELLALVRELERKNAELLQENERLKQAQHRQATPFSKGRGVDNPKKPGRKKGQRPFRRREAPMQKPTGIAHAEAPPNCPFCGGPVECKGEESATITDLPPRPQPEVTLYRVAVCPVYQVRQDGCGARLPAWLPINMGPRRIGPGQESWRSAMPCITS